MASAATLFKEPLIKKAAQALAQWIATEQIPVDQLERRIQAKEPVLEEALRRISADDISRVRLAVRPILHTLTKEDYWRVLTYLWEMPACRDHALMLQRYFHSDFVAAMDKIKHWLQTGSPS